MKDSITKFKVFYISDIDKQEQWFREMANKGYHFQENNFLGFGYRFKKGPCEDSIYRIDFKTKISDKQDYYNLYREYDFEFIDRCKFFSYFKYTGSTENYDKAILYNDPKEQLTFINKFIIFISIMLTVELAIFTGFTFMNFYNTYDTFSQSVIIGVFSLLMLSLLTRLSISSNKLKKKYKEIEPKEYYENTKNKSIITKVFYCTSLISIYIIFLSFMIYSETISPSTTAISNHIISSDKGFGNPIKTIDSLLFTDIDELKIVFYSSSENAGLKILKKSIFNRYSYNYTNIRFDILDNDFLRKMEFENDKNNYKIFYGKDSKKEINKVTLIYDDNTTKDILPIYEENSNDFLFALRLPKDRSAKVIMYDKYNNEINTNNMIGGI